MTETIKAPDWNNDPFKPSQEYDCVDTVEDLKQLIIEAAEIFRENKPRSKKELTPIKQSIRRLEVTLMGGLRCHTDLDIWVTMRTLAPAMQIFCSMRKLKDTLEKVISKDEAKELYIKTMNAFRYVNEKEDIDSCICQTSGDTIGSVSVISAIPSKAKPPSVSQTVNNAHKASASNIAQMINKIPGSPDILRLDGYVFVGDGSPMERSENPAFALIPTGSISLIHEILETLDKCQEQDEKPPHLTEDQVDLLNWYEDQYPKVCFVAKYPKRTYKTNFENAKLLRNIGLIKRPCDKNRGDIITGKGQSYIKSYFS